MRREPPRAGLHHRRSTRSMWLAGLIGLMVLGCQQPQRGGAPRRVVTLTPSLTETVVALGAGDLLVGVDRYSAPGRDLPRVGGFLDPDAEAIVALRPDLVILDEVQARVGEGLRGLGVRTLVLPLQSIADVRGALLAVGGALDRGEAARARVAELDAGLAGLPRGAGPRVLFVVDRLAGGLGGMVAAGPGTYVDEILGRLGAVNVLHDAPARYVRISPEEILLRQPEVILDAVHTEDAGAARRDWDALDIPATRAGRVHVLADSAAVTPGPGVVAFARALAPLLR